jgi:hypothetical protein
MSEYNYELKQSFGYAKNGDTQEASFITLIAPNFKQMPHMTPIKQAFMSAISEITETTSTSETASESEPGDINGAQVMQLMHRWSGDLTKVFLHAQELFKSGAALVDGQERLTVPLMEKMGLTDFENMVGAYIANFIAPSLMDGA